LSQFSKKKKQLVLVCFLYRSNLKTVICSHCPTFKLALSCSLHLEVQAAFVAGEPKHDEAKKLLNEIMEVLRVKLDMADKMDFLKAMPGACRLGLGWAGSSPRKTRRDFSSTRAC
jgi:hypothetical protein